MRKTARARIECIDIEVSKNRTGYIYALGPTTMRLLQRDLNAHPVKSISVNYNHKEGFEGVHGDILKYIVPALLGLQNKQDIQKIGKIRLIKAFYRDVLEDGILELLTDFDG